MFFDVVDSSLNVLRFRMDGIMLPDSNSNEPESHGYIVFDINPKFGVMSPTVVRNRVGIYFDTNDPIITNEVFNTLVDEIPECEDDETLSIEFGQENESFTVYPNPSSGSFNIDFGASAFTGDILFYDISGRLITSKKINEKHLASIQIKSGSGIYVLKIISKFNQTAIHKVTVL